jgi:hypothetical protein
MVTCFEGSRTYKEFGYKLLRRVFGPMRDEVETEGHFIMRNSVIYTDHLLLSG